MIGTIFQDRRQPGHQDVTARRPVPHRPPTGSQPVPPGEALDDTPLLSSPSRDAVVTDGDAQNAWRTSSSLSDGHPAKYCIALRHSVCREPRRSSPWSPVLRHPLPNTVGGSSKGQTQNSSVTHSCGKQEKCTISSEDFWVNSTLDNNMWREKMHPQTEEQRGERACDLAARGSISKAMKELVGGAAAGTAEHRKDCTTALIPRSSGRGTHQTQSELKQRA